MDDNKLIKNLVDASGLPEEFILKTLTRILLHNGVNPVDANLEDVRKVTADYLLDVFTEILDEGLRLDPATDVNTVA